MPFDEQTPRLSPPPMGGSPRGPGLIGRIVAALVGAALLIVSFALSAVVFAVVLVVAVIAGGYFWWKTRALRQQIQVQMQAQAERQRAATEKVVEGEVIRD